MTTLLGYSITWVVWTNMWLVTSRFLFFHFCFICIAPRSDFLTDRDDLYAKMRVSGQECACWGSQLYLTTLVGSNSNLQKPHLGINDGSENSISRKVVNRLTQNFLLFFGPAMRLRAGARNTVLQIQDGGFVTAIINIW